MASSLRVVHVLDHSLPLQSGYVFRTLGILGAQRGFGWETIQLTTPRNHPGAPAFETIDGWDFHRTSLPATWLSRKPIARELLEMRATSARLRGLIDEFRPDIIHAHSPVLNGLPALWAARRAGLPLIYEVRALWEDAAVDLGHSREGDLRYRLTRGLETWLLRRADAVVTLCQSMREEIVSRGVPEDRVVVVPNAVDPIHFQPAPARDPELINSLGLAGRQVLGFIGSFYHYEGLDLLLAALPRIRAVVPNVLLLLVGGGPEAERLQRDAAELGLGDAVRFTGRVPRDRVREYYGMIDFLVYPRRSMRLTELVTPLKPLEAMAEGHIVLASDIGGHRELIRDRETGFLFPPDDPAAIADGIIAAMAATDRHAAMRADARRFVETERNWPVCVGASRPVYDRLAAAHRR